MRKLKYTLSSLMIPIPTTPTPKPTATATIEPMGRRTAAPREHSITVLLKLSSSGTKHADKDYAATVARRSLDSFSGGDQRRFGDVSVSTRGKAGAVTHLVVSVEGSLVWPGRPEDAAVKQLCTTLLDEGYAVAVREKRECAESGCGSNATIDWNRRADAPPGWYSHELCGKHNYRMCGKCKSTYVLSSTNAAGQSPSLHCEVCGEVMIEWGGSKIWSAELLTRGEAPLTS
jgi:hypothetical protein